jgi:hypothetical protein
VERLTASFQVFASPPSLIVKANVPKTRTAEVYENIGGYLEGGPVEMVPFDAFDEATIVSTVRHLIDREEGLNAKDITCVLLGIHSQRT